MADALAGIPSLSECWLRGPATRSAVRRLLEIPGLRLLAVLFLAKPGRLCNFEAATELEHFSSYDVRGETDLLAIARCPALRELFAMDCHLTARALDALLALPHLKCLSLERAGIDDALAGRFVQSAKLERLHIPSNPLGRAGLAQIVRLEQLRELDLWATPLSIDDLDLLQQLPQLEYLSLGGGDAAELERLGLTAAALLARLSALPVLRRVELDGIVVDETQRAAFAARFDSVRILEN